MTLSQIRLEKKKKTYSISYLHFILQSTHFWTNQLHVAFIQSSFFPTKSYPPGDSITNDALPPHIQQSIHCLHPGRLTWNLQVTHLERKMIFQTSMIMFHVNLQGCIMQPKTPTGPRPCRAKHEPKAVAVGAPGVGRKIHDLRCMNGCLSKVGSRSESFRLRLCCTLSLARCFVLNIPNHTYSPFPIKKRPLWRDW